MIVEYIRYHIEGEDAARAFEAGYVEAAKSLEASPECLAYELSRCTEAPADWILRIEWTSEEAHLQGFRKGPRFPPFLAAIRTFIPNIQEMRHYAVTPLSWRRT